MGVEVIHVQISHHIGDDGNFLLGADDQLPGLQHPIRHQVLGELDAGIPHKHPPDILGAHIVFRRDGGERLGRTVVALNQEDNFVGDFGEGGILHAQHRVQIFSGLDGLRLRAVRAAEQNPLQKFLHFFSRQRIEQVILGAGAHGGSDQLRGALLRKDAEYGIQADGTRMGHQFVAHILAQLQGDQGNLGGEIQGFVHGFYVGASRNDGRNTIIRPVQQHFHLSQAICIFVYNQ